VVAGSFRKKIEAAFDAGQRNRLGALEWFRLCCATVPHSKAEQQKDGCFHGFMSCVAGGH